MQQFAHLRPVLERLIYLEKLSIAARERYSHGATADRLRASVIAADIAVLMDIENSPSFRADLTQALRAAGWRSVLVKNVRLWKGVRRR